MKTNGKKFIALILALGLACKRFCQRSAIVFFVITIAVPLLGQTVVGTISKPGMVPTAVAVYEAEGRVFVADNSTGNLYIYDEDSLEEIGSVFVGKETYEIVVHQGNGKLYAASESENKITVIDADMGTVLFSLSITYAPVLAVDEEFGKVYVVDHSCFRQIDVVTDSVITIPEIHGIAPFRNIAINPITHEVYISNFTKPEMDIIDGITLEHSILGFYGYPCGPGVVVNWIENKVYVAWGEEYIAVPGIILFDRNNGTTKLLDTENDALSFVFNPASNRIYSSSELNRISTIIEGKSDEFFNLPMLGGADAIEIRYATGHLYFCNQNFIAILNDQTQLLELIQVDDTLEGGVIVNKIAINQTTGRVYVINDGLNLNFVTVLQDTEMMVRPPLFVSVSYRMYVVDPISKKVVDEWMIDRTNKFLAIRPGGGRVYVSQSYQGWDNVLGIYAGASDGLDTSLISTVETGGWSPIVPTFTPDGKYIYVTNSESNNVGMIDVESNSLSMVIPVGTRPWGITVIPDGTKVFVANMDDDTVSVIDTVTNTVAKSISVQEKPWGVVANPSSTKVYVVNSQSNSVSVIDTDSDSVIETIMVGNNPHWATITPDGSKVFVTNQDHGTVSVIDTGNDIVVDTIQVGNNPEGLCVNPDGGEVYVFNDNMDQSSPSSLYIINVLDHSVAYLGEINIQAESGGIGVADPTSKFAGRVTAGDSPTSGALVRALQGGEEIGMAVANEAGDYSIFNLKSGTYNIEVSAPDYFSQTLENQTVEVGRIAVLNFSLIPSITVISPNGGESWDAGSSHMITWTSEGSVGNVKIDYSTNNGSSWTEIVSSTANDGSYDWILPNTSSSNCLVKISEIDGSPSDVSNAVFAIIAPKYTLTISATTGGTTDPAPGTHTYDSGTEVTINAIPNSGYRFSNWSGSASGTDNPITITMDSDKSITANFTATPPDNGDGGGKKGGCFIATAAYGSTLHPHLDVLRDFKDKYLMPSKIGRSIVNFYYKYSPFVAELITKHKALRTAVRIHLLPLVAFSYSMVHLGPIITAVMLLFILVLPAFLVWLYRRKARSIA